MKVKPATRDGHVAVTVELTDEEALDLWQHSKQIYPVGRELRKALDTIIVEQEVEPLYEERATIQKVHVGFQVVPAHISGRDVEAEERRLEQMRRRGRPRGSKNRPKLPAASE